MDFPPLKHHKKIIELSILKGLKHRSDEAYDWIQHKIKDDQLSHVLELPNGGKYVKSSHSFTIDAILKQDECNKVLNSILDVEALKPYRSEYPFVNLDQAWIRRKDPNRLDRMGLHSWHQDGALGFPFHQSGANYHDGLLDMVTIWIPLDPCGIVAPGLELINVQQSRVFKMEELIEIKIRNQFDKSLFEVPHLGIGDALVFNGSLIHRTFFKEGMSQSRTSLGIRLFKEIPERFKGAHFVKIDDLSFN